MNKKRKVSLKLLHDDDVSSQATSATQWIRSDSLSVPPCSKKSTWHKSASYHASPRTNDNASLWLDKFSPTSLDGLCVHKKKISEISGFLEFSLTVKESSLLFLSGPSGCGKTLALHLIAQSLGIPLHTVEEETMAALVACIHRLDRFPISSTGKHAILLEELPPIVFQDISAFHSAVENFSRFGRNILIVVACDSHLFSNDFLHKVGMTHLQLNPVAKTTLVRILSSLTAKTAIRLDKTSISRIADFADGDIRSAISSLQFTASSRSYGVDSDVVFAKDDVYQLFRAVGKILHGFSKRSNVVDTNCLPSHLSCCGRSTLSFVPECAIENCSVSLDSYLGYLQENYISHFCDLTEIASCSDAMSDAEVLASSWNPESDLKPVALSLAVRSLLFHNTCSDPKKFTPIVKPKSSALYYASKHKAASATFFFPHILKTVAHEEQNFPSSTFNREEIEVEIEDFDEVD